MSDKFEDPKIKDKKSLPFSELSESIPLFFISVFISTPLLIAVFIPASIISQAIKYAHKKIVGNPKKAKASFVQEDPKELIKAIKKRSSDLSGRKYDIVIFGATGFTGKLSAVYVAKHYGTSIKWAIAGRRKDALQKLKDELIAIDSNLVDLPLIIADSFDSASLDELTKQTKVVATTAGPFALYGKELVKSCVLHGTHYTDITGETDFSRDLIDQYDEVAKVSGAKIVNFCGHDCVPWDLAALESVNALKKKNDTLQEIHFYDEVNSAPSGGTIATVFYSLTDRAKRPPTLLGFDPLLKTKEGEKSANKFIVKNQTFLGYSHEYGSWLGPFVMAPVMANCVKRTNVLNNYATKIVYREGLVYASFFAGFVDIVSLLLFATSLFLPPWQYILTTYLLPKQGEGPSKEKMDQGFLKITAFAKGTNGGKVKTMFYFPTDPGYRDTARILVEASLALALQEKEIAVGGGIWTPAACQGSVLTKRLTESGSILKIEELK